jgi:hypothetical protein
MRTASLFMRKTSLFARQGSVSKPLPDHDPNADPTVSNGEKGGDEGADAEEDAGERSGAKQEGMHPPPHPLRSGAKQKGMWIEWLLSGPSVFEFALHTGAHASGKPGACPCRCWSIEGV